MVRTARVRHGWRQDDLAAAAKVSRGTTSRIERGHFGQVSLDTLRRVAAALDIRLDLQPRWSGGDLERLVGARHSALHETVARTFQQRWPAWTIAPEVSFSIWGERGVIDFLAWHPERHALLVGELKTEVVDVNELIGTLDRKRRLAADVARERGWEPRSVSSWLIVSGSRTNRRRVAAHETMLRAAYPADGPQIRTWLREPNGSIAASIAAMYVLDRTGIRTEQACTGSAGPRAAPTRSRGRYPRA